jgi:hypothetical protein
LFDEPILSNPLASTWPKATGTPELADTGDALKLDDTESGVVGQELINPTTGMTPPVTAHAVYPGRAAPDADRSSDRFGRGTAHDPIGDGHNYPAV